MMTLFVSPSPYLNPYNTFSTNSLVEQAPGSLTPVIDMNHIIAVYLAEIGMYRGQLVCIHLHLVDGLLKDANSSKGLSEMTSLSDKFSKLAAHWILCCHLQIKNNTN